MAMMLRTARELQLVIGVTPRVPTLGRAWLEADGEVLLEDFTVADAPYVVIRRLDVASHRCARTDPETIA